jgi:hypothetical protein
MRTLLELMEKTAQISQYVSKDYSYEPIVLQERSITLTGHLQTSGELMADSQYLYDIEYAKQTEILFKDNPKIAPTMVDKLVKGKVAEYNRLLILTDRLNRSITHQLDSIRTLISFLKSEIYNT